MHEGEGKKCRGYRLRVVCEFCCQGSSCGSVCEYLTGWGKPLGESAVLQETFVYVNMFWSCWISRATKV